MMHRRQALRLVAALLLPGAPVAAAPPKDTWSEPFSGVRYLRRTTDEPKKWDLHLCLIDLTDPGIRVRATVPEDRGMTTPKWAQKTGVQVAINGGFSSGGYDKSYTPPAQRPSGPTLVDGKLWPDPRNPEGKDFLGSFAEGDGRIDYIDPGVPVKPEPWMHNLITGSAMILRNGEAVKDMTDEKRMNPRHPRTAVGTSKDRRTLILLVVDGRQKHSVGMTGKERQPVFLEFGGWDAINFDGGGSSCMYIEGKGVLNKPSDGSPRHVVNHVGLNAKPGPGRPKGQIRGFVKEAGTGKPLTGVKVALNPAHADVTDGKGFFHLTQVPAGDARLTVTADGFADGRVTVDVTAGQTADSAVELTPKAK